MFKLVYFVSRSQFASHNHAKRTGPGRKNFNVNGTSFAPEGNASGIATNSIVESDGATSPLKNFVATVNSVAAPSTLDSLNNNTDNQDVVRQKRLPGGISFVLGLLFSLICSVADIQAETFVDLDSISSGQVSQNSATSWTWSHTNGTGTNRLLLVGCVINNSASEDILAVTNTFNGVRTPLTKIGSVSNGPNVLISYFYLRDAPVGSNSLTAYNGGNGGQAIGGSVSYFGINPNATFNLQYATGSTMVASLTMTNIAENEVIFDIIGQRPTNTILAAESSATLRWIRNTTFGAAAKNVRAASSTKEKLTPGVGDLTINWTNSGGAGTNWVLAAVALGAPPAPAISTIPDHTIVEDGATTNINFNISTDAGGPPLLFGSTNQSLVPTANIQITQIDSSNFTVKATPVANQFGTTLISITNADYAAVVPRYAVRSFLLTVLPVDDQPTLNTIGNQTVLEDAGMQNVSLGGISAGAPSNENGQTVTITAISSDPAIVPNPSISYTQGNSTGSLTYTPAANGSGTATITVTAQDNGGTSNGGIDTIVRTFNITVTPVNDAPTLDAVSNRTINEDSAQTINLTGISAGPASESSQTIVVLATSSNPSVIPDPTVTHTSPGATGTLQFTPVANASGSATITVTVQDNGGTASGGVNLLTRTFNVSVTAVNDAPTMTALSNVTINEDASMQVINLSGIGSGASDEGLQLITVTATSPVANAFGVATITVVATDTGGTANGGVNAKTNTFTVTVNGVNDVPSFTKGANQSVLEDAAPQTVANWAPALSAGPANESVQALTFNVSNNNNSLFSVQPAVSSSGTLTYTAAANASGSATVTISLSDDGGTAHSGVDTSAAQTFTISVTAVNDAPTLTAISNLTIAEDASLQAVNLSGISSGAPNESQTLVVTATSSNTGLIPHPAVSYTSPNVAGTLSFSPVANVHGSATISVVLADGVQSITNTFLVTVTSVEDAPTLAAIGNLTINEDATTQAVNLSGISSGAATEVQTLTVTAVSSNPTLVPHPTVSYTSAQSTGALTFSPSANEHGSATVSVVVNDGVLA